MTNTRVISSMLQLPNLWCFKYFGKSKNESRESINSRKIQILFTAGSLLDRSERLDKVPKTYKTHRSFSRNHKIKLVTVTKESITVKNQPKRLTLFMNLVETTFPSVPEMKANALFR